MEHPELFSISPADGRYASQTASLRPYFSEAALIRYRIRVEVEYLIALCALGISPLKPLQNNEALALQSLYRQFDPAFALRIKEIEKTTNHDVKAVEYFLREEVEKLGFGWLREFIHFGLTSQDINNTAQPMAFRDAQEEVYLPALNRVLSMILDKAREWQAIPMLARTHGQPASPTLLGKEIYVFAERISNQIEMLKATPFAGKFGGATGNFNAHYAAYPTIDWHSFANDFLTNSLKLKRLQTTTQIDHYDYLAAWFDNLSRINTILIDFCRDVWSYISMEYFQQKIKPSEVGSSAMPHKVNPIDFENAEGNLGLANVIFHHFSAKLPVSRLQRDLTDSTVLRNAGVPVAHTLIALKSVEKGINKLIINKEVIEHDLENNWAVLAEAIQTILRREGYHDPYTALKELTRTHSRITKTDLHHLIDSLSIAEGVKHELKALTPFGYTGVFRMPSP